ncbi:chorismate mutase [Azorhizobium doebereinerae]|uniref:chorismate mutase n=1 Tax=Azorhizobium doebereinerae TaxID=281091 RepID=UPI000427307B|nr:chorismate mutase [Azorhizobium doebereinerae]
MDLRTLPAVVLLVCLTGLRAGAAESDPPRPLEVLRSEIDRVDRDLLRLLNERAAIVAEVGRGKAAGSNAAVFRPGRQAALIRKLAAEPGLQPPATILRIWTAIIAGSILQQKPDFTIAVVDDGDAAVVLLAQDYFGAQPSRVAVGSPEAALSALAEHRADAAVLGLDGAWWQRLPEGVQVVAAAPFARREKDAPAALILARQEIDPSGDDITVARLPLDADPTGAVLLGTGSSQKLWAFAKGMALPSAAEPIGLYARPLVFPAAPDDKRSAQQ